MVLYIFKCCYYSPTRILWTLSYISSKMLIKCCGKHNMIEFFGILTHKFWTHEKHVFHWEKLPALTNTITVLWSVPWDWHIPPLKPGMLATHWSYLQSEHITEEKTKWKKKTKQKIHKERPLLGFLPFSVCAWHAQVTWWWEKDQVNGKRLQVRGQVEVRSGCRTSTQVCCLWKRAEGGEGLTVMGAVEKPENHVLTLGKKRNLSKMGVFSTRGNLILWFYR